MKWIYAALVIFCFTRFECQTQEETRCGALCKTYAVVKDLSALDGCGFVLELDNGTRLIPERRVYIQAPDPKEDPAYYFQFADGQKVCVDFTEVDGADVCMAGKLVFLTCIKECNANNSSE